MMDARGGETFAMHLRRARRAAGLTQRELARRAGLSERGLSDLERGISRSARRDSARLLADALALTGTQRARFLAAAQRRPADIAPMFALALPVPATSFIGRETEVDVLAAWLRAPETRLVTVTGPGGVGKTRLALAAARAAEGFPDGASFIDLSAIGDAELVSEAIAQELGITDTEQGDGFLAQALVAYLGEREVLLVLDNFEQVIDASPFVATLLSRCPGVTMLLTSREPLRIRGEREFPAPALELPDPRRLSLDGEQSAAVVLFVERLRIVRPEFRLTDENLRVVAEICRRLEGMPLAIELAAARGNLLSPSELLRRMDRRLDLLTGGPRDAPPRQRTMRDAIAWSHDLLGPAEQVLFRRLAIFAGGMSLDAACWVTASEDWVLSAFLPSLPGARHEPDLEAPPPGALADGLDRMATLVRGSLVQRLLITDEETRLRMLETVREYALNCLHERGEVEVRRRHARYFLALAELAATHQHGAHQRIWLDRLEREHDNLRAAAAWAIDAREAATALRLCGALGHFWRARGHLSEGRRWCQRALALPDHANSEARANACHVMSMLAHWQGDAEVAKANALESLTLYQELGDERGVAMSLNALGIFADDLGDYVRARELHEESLRRWAGLNDQWGMAHALSALGTTAKTQGRLDEAVTRYERSLQLFRGCEDELGVALVLDNLGETALRRGELSHAARRLEEALWRQRALENQQLVARHLDKLGMVRMAEGQIDAAEALFEESLALQSTLGDRRGMASSLIHLGDVARARDDIPLAAGRYQQSLDLRRTLQNKVGLVACLEDVAALIASSLPREAARLYGAVEAQRMALGTPANVERAIHEAALRETRASLGPPAFDPLWREGATWPLADAAARAMQIVATLADPSLATAGIGDSR